VPYGAGGFSFAGADKMLTRSGATLPKIAIFWGKSSVLTQQKVNSAQSDFFGARLNQHSNPTTIRITFPFLVAFLLPFH
jgi:hypothetical protein